MIRDTSIEAYNTIKANGLLSERRFEVYEALYFFGPMTQTQVSARIKHALAHSITPRFAELKHMGVIIEVGEVICETTGMNVILWDVTKNLPTPLDKKRPKIEIEKELISAIVSLGKEVNVPKWKDQLRQMYKLAAQLITK